MNLGGHYGLWQDPELALWRRAMTRALAEVDPSLGRPLSGDAMLREELGRLLGIDPTAVIVTSGIRPAAVALGTGASRALIERPTFLGVPRALAAAGVPVEFTDSWPATTSPDTIAWFTAPCRNPDGRPADRATLQAAARYAAAGAVVVCDTALRWWADLPELPAGVVEVGTLHKLAGPGAQLGWVRGDQLTDAQRTLLALTTPPRHWQRAWAWFLRAGGARLLVDRCADMPATRAAFLDGAGRAEPEGYAGPLILLPVEDEPAALARLDAAGVTASPGSAFAADGPSIRVHLPALDPAEAAAAGRAVSAALADVGASTAS